MCAPDALDRTYADPDRLGGHVTVTAQRDFDRGPMLDSSPSGTHAVWMPVLEKNVGKAQSVAHEAAHLASGRVLAEVRIGYSAGLLACPAAAPSLPAATPLLRRRGG